MEANSINTIQEIVNKRARKRLNDDIDNIAKFLRDAYHILGETTIEIVVPEVYKDKETSKSKTIVLTHIITYLDTHIREKRLEEYTKRETEMFVQEVEELKQRVKDLENGITYE